VRSAPVARLIGARACGLLICNLPDKSARYAQVQNTSALCDYACMTRRIAERLPCSRPEFLVDLKCILVVCTRNCHRALILQMENNYIHLQALQLRA